jgi:hypothetical protein
MPVAIDGESLSQIIEARKTNKTSWSELDVTAKPTLPIYVWDKVTSETNSNEIIDIVYEVYIPEGDAVK